MGDITFLFSKLSIPIAISLHKKSKTITFDEISSDLKDTIIRLALGDLYIRRRNLNTCFNFKQGIKNKDYIIHLY